MPGQIYVIEAPFAPWLWPLLAVCGICCQLAAVHWRKKWLLLSGVPLVIAASIAERDLTLFAGDAVATVVLFLYLHKMKNKFS